MDNWLRNSNVVKAVALLLGILLWAIVQLDQSTPSGGGFTSTNEKLIYNVKVTPIYDESRVHIISIDPQEVMIRAEGRESALNKIPTSQYQIALDLRNAQSGENTIPLVARNFPSGVQVSIVPSYAKVTLDLKQDKEVPVQVNLIGNPADGYKAGQPIVRPVRAIVKLPSSMMDEEITVNADVNIEQAETAVSRQVKLVALDRNGKELDVLISPAVVDVEVPITQPFKKMPLQLRIIGNPSHGYSVASLRTSFDQITVYGPQDLLNKMDFYEGPELDLNGLTRDKEFSLDIPLRDRVSLLDPAKVEVQVEVVPSHMKTLSRIPITIIGQNNLYRTTTADPEAGVIEISVEAAPAILDRLKAQDVQAIVDVSNLPQGTHSLPVMINLPQFVKLLTPNIRAEIVISAQNEG